MFYNSEGGTSAKESNRMALKSVLWTLAEFRDNRIVQSPNENYFNVCRQLKEKWGLVNMTIYVFSRRNHTSLETKPQVIDKVRPQGVYQAYPTAILFRTKALPLL